MLEQLDFLMDYNKLKTFVVVAENGSISAAARGLSRTQSAITQQIQQLEEELGFALFDRNNGRIYLTRAGDQLRDVAGQMLGDLDDKILHMKNELTSVEGHLRIGVLEDFGTARLCNLIAAFKENHPRIRISLIYGPSETIEAHLLANQVDIGFLITYKDKTFFNCIPLSVDSHVLCTSRDYWLDRGPFNTIEQIIDADLIDFSDYFPCLGTWVKKNQSALASRLLRRKPDVVLASHSGIKAIIKAGYGIAILPHYLISLELKEGSIVHLLQESKSIRAGIDFAFRKKHKEKLCEKLFREYVFKKIFEILT